MLLHPRARGRALAIAAAGLALLVAPAAARAQTANPDVYDCRGHIQAGAPEPGDDSQQVEYTFGCNGPITGYQIQADQPIGGFDSAPYALDGAGNAVTTDAFTCSGDIPTLGFNCVGTYSDKYVNNRYETVVGEFSIAHKLCAEPRVDPLLTVVYATGDKTGKVTQHISGPYDLGRPQGCKPDSHSGKTRIPKDGLTIGGSTTSAKSKPAKKPKKAKKTKHH